MVFINIQRSLNSPPSRLVSRLTKHTQQSLSIVRFHFFLGEECLHVSTTLSLTYPFLRSLPWLCWIRTRRRRERRRFLTSQPDVICVFHFHQRQVLVSSSSLAHSLKPNSFIRLLSSRVTCDCRVYRMFINNLLYRMQALKINKTTCPNRKRATTNYAR